MSEAKEKNIFACKKYFFENKFLLAKFILRKNAFFAKKRLFSNSINTKVYRGMRFFRFLLAKNEKKNLIPTIHQGFIEFRVYVKSLLFAKNAKKRRNPEEIFRKCVAFTKDFFGISEKNKKEAL